MWYVYRTQYRITCGKFCRNPNEESDGFEICTVHVLGILVYIPLFLMYLLLFLGATQRPESS